MGLRVGIHVQHVGVRGTDEIEIVHECAECKRLLIGDGQAESMGGQRRIKAHAASVIE